MTAKSSSCFRCALHAAVLLAAAAFLPGCGDSSAKATKSSKGGRQGVAGQPMPVAVAPVETRDLPVYLSGLGSVEAYYTVLVKTRVDGQLVQVNFREGQEVKKGDLLVVVDPRPYQAALSQTEATLFKDQAALKDAKVNLDRFKELFQSGSGLSGAAFDRALEILRDPELIAEARSLASVEVRNAREMLNELRPSPYRDSLAILIDEQIDREV